MNWEQQRAQILATIKSKKGLIAGVLTKAANENRTTSDAEETQVKAVEDDVARLEANLARVEGFIADLKAAAENATPAAGGSEAEAGASAEGNPEPEKANSRVTVKSNLAPGIGFAKAMRAKAAAQMERRNGKDYSALDIAKSRNEPEQVIQYLQKDAVIGRTTATEYESLIEPDNLSNEFIELLRKRTIFDKLKGFREVPFNTKITSQIAGGTAEWVGEGNVKPVTNPAFGNIRIAEYKLAAIAVFTDELLRNSKPKADTLFLDDLLIACAELIDSTFIGSAAGTDNKPAGILNGVTPITGTGMTTEQAEADFMLLITEFLNNNKSLAGAQYIMSEVRANQFARMRDALGNRYHLGMQGGISEKALDGIEVIESESAANKIIMIKPSEILLADDGAVDVSYSNEATIVNGAETVNLWQQNMSAVRVERYIAWAKRRATAVSYIQYT